MSKQVLITSSNYSDGSVERGILEPLGIEVKVINSPAEGDVIQNAAGVMGILVGYTPIGKQAMDALPDLKIIVRTGIGYENIDLNAAREHHIRVCNVPDYCLDEVADHTLALLLSLERKIVQQTNVIMQEGRWEGVKAITPIYGLQGRALGLVGFGGIGRNVARRAQAFGMKVIAHDPYAKPEVAQALGVELVSLDQLLVQSDYISLHVPVTSETMHVINAESLKKMKPTAYLINTSRGPLVETDALVEALAQKRIAGAALDVVEEDLQGALKFSKLPNVIITPHTAYYSLASSRKMKVSAAEEIARFLKGEPPKNPVV